MKKVISIICVIAIMLGNIWNSPIRLDAATSTSLPKISGATFTKYNINLSKTSSIWSVGNLVCTWDGKNTRYYGPSGKLIKTFEGDASSIYGILENTYVKENDGEYSYADTYINGTKYDESMDGYSDFIWVNNCIINIRTGKVLDQYSFDGIYGTSLFVWTPDFVDGVAPIRVNGKYGVMTDAGNIIIEPKYESCFVISGGYSILQNSEGKWAYADQNGTISDFKFMEIRSGEQKGVLIGSIEKKYLYDTTKAQEVLDLYEKVLINQGKEYSLCYNWLNCSVDLGNFSDGYAHAVIKYYYVSPTSLELKTYTTFDGYVDSYGKKKIDFADHESEDTEILNELAAWKGVDIDIFSSPLSIDASSKPEISHSTYFKYGLLLVSSKIASASMSGAAETSLDYKAGYTLYDKTGKKLLTLYNTDYETVEVADQDLIVCKTKDGILRLLSKNGTIKLSVSYCSRYNIERSEAGHAIIRIFQKLDASSKETAGLYYEETGYSTGQFYGFPEKVTSGNDDYKFKMYDIDGFMIVSKNKKIISKTVCVDIRPTLEGYVVIKNTKKNNYYKLDYYTASGVKKNSITSGPYCISSYSYGTIVDHYTNSSSILDGKYYDGLGNCLINDTFWGEDNYMNHGFALVRKNDGKVEEYGILSSSGKMTTGFIFTSNDKIYRHSDEKRLNKYGSLLVCYKNVIYRFHSDL